MKFLIVEDESCVSEVLTRALEGLGYSCLRAGDVASAEQLLQDNDFEALTVDLGMPGMGGRQCLKQLLALDPSAKVLVTTGYGLTGRAQGILDEGIAGFINKPYRLSELARRTKSILDDLK